jgi:uncharacterized protein
MTTLESGLRATFNTEVSIFGSEHGDFIVHLPLMGRAFKVDDRARQIIESLKAGREVENSATARTVINRLEELGLLGESRHAAPTVSLIDSFTPTEATLLFTESCNLSCSYCYASSQASKTRSMDAQIMRAAVDLVCENAAETEARHAWFRYIGGGEPTLEWPFLEQTTDYVHKQCASKNVQSYIRLITNGTLLTPD